MNSKTNRISTALVAAILASFLPMVCCQAKEIPSFEIEKINHALEYGCSFGIFEVASVTEIPGNEWGGCYYKVKPIEVPLPFEIGNLPSYISLYAGWSYGQDLKIGRTYGLFFREDSPIGSFSWCCRDDYFQVNSFPLIPEDQEKIDLIKKIYSNSKIKIFREKPLAVVELPELPNNLLEVCMEFKKKRKVYFDRKSEITSSAIGHSKHKNPVLSNSRNSLPQLRLSKDQVFSLLGPPDRRSGRDFIYYFKGTKSNPESLVIVFSKKDEMVSLIW